MSGPARTRAEIVDMCARIHERLRREPPATEAARRDEYTFLNALTWAAGGCVNPFHPPECRNVEMPSCTDPKPNRGA